MKTISDAESSGPEPLASGRALSLGIESFAEATDAETLLTIESAHARRSVKMYSPEGFAALSALYTKAAVHNRLAYQCSWLGVQIIQFPTDLIVYQELIWNLKPDLIIECGIAHGGSLIFYASILELLGSGRVIGIDVDIRAHNRASLEAHPLAHRITLVEGSSIEPATVAAVKAVAGGAQRVMVLLDSRHTTDHVLAELHAYKGFVLPGGYLVAGDGTQALVGDIPLAQPEWRESSPLHAITRFLEEDADFEIDDTCTRFGITQNASGYLRRRADGST
jgi:cephalosporin hydroxylase